MTLRIGNNIVAGAPAYVPATALTLANFIAGVSYLTPLGSLTAFPVFAGLQAYSSSIGVAPQIMAYSSGAQASYAGSVAFKKDRAGSAVLSGDGLGGFFWSPFDGGAYPNTLVLQGTATENHSPTTRGSTYSFEMTKVGATSRTVVAKFEATTGDFMANGYRVTALNAAPASASATGTLGEIRYDANYMYLCTATNTWKRSALTSW